jgi:uncharacterized membrane protein YhaH (DUF805 family)
MDLVTGRTMTVTSLFLSPKGRISRSQFWLGMLGVAATLGGALAIAFWTPFAYAAVPFLLIAFLATYMIAIKRLHDRNKSGWWTLVFLWLPGVTDRLSDQVVEESAMWWILVLIGTALSLWGVIELGFRRGTDGGNQYGPDPIRKPEVTAHAV